MHARQQIRDAVKTLLIGNTAAGQSVFENRTSTLTPIELPAIVIASEKETSVPRDNINSQYIRHLTLLIEIRVQATADSAADDALDNLAQQVESLIQMSGNAAGPAYSMLLTDTAVQFSAEGDSYTGHLTLTYDCTYIF